MSEVNTAHLVLRWNVVFQNLGRKLDVRDLKGLRIEGQDFEHDNRPRLGGFESA